MRATAHIVNSIEESKRLNELRMPAVIVSASGMASGGRVLHHLKAFAPEPATPSCSPASRPPARAARRSSAAHRR